MQQEWDIEKIIEKTEGEIRLSERDQSLEQARRSMEQLRLTKPAPTYTERVASRKPTNTFTAASPLSLPQRFSQQESYQRDSVSECQDNDDVAQTPTMSHFQRLAGFRKPNFSAFHPFFSLSRNYEKITNKVSKITDQVSEITDQVN